MLWSKDAAIRDWLRVSGAPVVTDPGVGPHTVLQELIEVQAVEVIGAARYKTLSTSRDLLFQRYFRVPSDVIAMM
jgi:hypothetical protein